MSYMQNLLGRWGKVVATSVVLAGVVASAAYAAHSWGNYHWARTANPFTLKLGDNVSAIWDGSLALASADWNVAPELETVVVPGATNPKNCRAVDGRVEVCSNKYGNTNWLGVASVWASGNHIVKATVKLNDTHFSKPKYNTPAWRQFVMCQEIGHAFGLDHQDEVFDNANMGTCMDYTNDPDGTIYGQPDNQHPNTHDFEQLGLIYSHTDSFNTILNSAFSNKGLARAAANDAGGEEDTGNEDPSQWGQAKRHDQKGRPSMYEKDLGRGNKLFTFVIWAD